MAQALGYKDTVNAVKAHSGKRKPLQRVRGMQRHRSRHRHGCRRTLMTRIREGGGRITTPSGQQEMVIINESGLYSLVLSSKLT